jgi:tRNA(Met) cytidine acetyltransferase
VNHPTTPDETVCLADHAHVTAIAAALTREARSSNHRLTLVLAGSEDWTMRAATAALCASPDRPATWLSNRPLPVSHLPLGAGVGLLGRDVDVLVFDSHSGFDPDSFAAAIGSIRGSGLLMFLTPPLDLWPQLPDPQAQRVAVYPAAWDQVSGRFLARFARVLTSSAGVTVIAEGQPSLHPYSVQRSSRVSGRCAPDDMTPDQSRAVDAILATARGRAHRPLILISDRGRGKTTALGIAAAALLAGEHDARIQVTAPRRSAVDPLFRHAARLLPSASAGRNQIALGTSSLEFRPPDAIYKDHRPADLLLVDEAAGIPAPILERLLKAYGRVVFATTVHGYEGTGRGFEVRFRRHLDLETPGWKALRLETPVRFAPGDPLEALTARALLLDAEPTPDVEVQGARPEDCIFERLDRQALGNDDATLSQVFGLLVLAHYQTRPLDLRHLLDGPNMRVYVLRHHRSILATALVAIEGGLAPALARDVFNGRRRPRGHLLPQTLCAHAGLAEAPGLRYARIVRIAAHPAAQRRGLGRRLLDGIAADARASELDLAGASFGASDDLLDFWLGCGFRPAHIGTSRNAASGAHAAVLLLPMSPAGERLLETARIRLGERLPIMLAGPLRDLNTRVTASLLAHGVAPGREPRSHVLEETSAFALAHRPFEAALPPLVQLICSRPGVLLADDLLTVSERDALIAMTLQHRPWGEAAEMTGANGRAGVISLLRQGTAKILGPQRAANGETSRENS